MGYAAFARLFGIDLLDFLHADAVFLRLDVELAKDEKQTPGKTCREQVGNQVFEDLKVFIHAALWVNNLKVIQQKNTFGLIGIVCSAKPQAVGRGIDLRRNRWR